MRHWIPHSQATSRYYGRSIMAHNHYIIYTHRQDDKCLFRLHTLHAWVLNHCSIQVLAYKMIHFSSHSCWTRTDWQFYHLIRCDFYRRNVVWFPHYLKRTHFSIYILFMPMPISQFTIDLPMFSSSVMDNYLVSIQQKQFHDISLFQLFIFFCLVQFLLSCRFRLLHLHFLLPRFLLHLCSARSFALSLTFFLSPLYFDCIFVILFILTWFSSRMLLNFSKHFGKSVLPQFCAYNSCMRIKVESL